MYNLFFYFSYIFFCLSFCFFFLYFRELSLLGLFLIAVGTGGIKPCVSSFGGDQFVLPQQEQQLRSFFSIFYFSINAGSVISSFLTPMLREYHCLGSNEDCYPLAFGLPAALMIVALGKYNLYISFNSQYCFSAFHLFILIICCFSRSIK